MGQNLRLHVRQRCRCKDSDLQAVNRTERFCAGSMYDVDGNGWIDLPEMTKIVRSIYRMTGPKCGGGESYETPEVRAASIFKRMDVNSDGKVTRQEFVTTCLDDQQLIGLLTPNVR